MKIDRRHFLKLLGAIGGAIAAEGLAPQGVLTLDKVVLPPEPTVVGAMPRMGGGISNFVEIEMKHAQMTLTLENPLLESYEIGHSPSLLTIGQASYVTVSLNFIADAAVMRELGEFPGGYLGVGRADGMLRMPRLQGEWLCVYCGSVNPMPQTHCAQCGAARDWVVT